MKIDLIAKNDENFSISEVRLNGTLTVDNPTVTEPYVIEDVLPEPQPINTPPAGVPLENFRQTNSFDLFAGTKWAGKPNSFN